MHILSGRRGRRLGLMILVCVSAAIFALATATASAQPQEPTMSLADLQALLAPTGSVPGYFLTTDKGAHIARIDCMIEGIVPQAGADNGDLILFDATDDPIIDAAGSIVAGMSGSPVYVHDPVDDRDELVGAVSYGEEFAMGGLGLATPIEHMMALESDFTIDPMATSAARTVPLARPVATATGRVDKVVLAPTATAARAARPGRRALVMRPLSQWQVAGVAADSPLVRSLKSDLAEKGIDLRVGLAGGAAGFSPSFSTPLVPGSSVGEVFLYGDYWYGGVGTTTYTTTDGKLVAFGHPMTWDGQV
jgi:hypothetical protein